MQAPEEIVAITDPGEKGREAQNWGDRLVVVTSNLMAWLFPVLMVAIVLQVFLRQAGMNQAWLDDLQWWLYGLAVLVGVAYAVTTDSHVRVDIFYDGFSDTRRARIDIFALGWLFLPFVILAVDMTFHYAVSSVQAWEGSSSPNGLHNLWILKILMCCAFVLMVFATLAAIWRNLDRVTEPMIWKVMLAALPATIFAVNLTIYYVLYWFVRASNPELNARAITREPVFENMLIYTAVGSVLALGAALMIDRWRDRPEI